MPSLISSIHILFNPNFFRFFPTFKMNLNFKHNFYIFYSFLLTLYLVPVMSQTSNISAPNQISTIKS